MICLETMVSWYRKRKDTAINKIIYVVYNLEVITGTKGELDVIPLTSIS
jgi:hypothetical protein